MCNRRGSIALNMVLSLMIASFLIPLVCMCVVFVMPDKVLNESIQDEIALVQLRRNLMTVYDLEVGYNQLNYRRDGNDRVLHVLNGRLIEQPGTLVFLSDIEGIVFRVVNGVIYGTYQRNNVVYEAVMGHE